MIFGYLLHLKNHFPRLGWLKKSYPKLQELECMPPPNDQWTLMHCLLNLWHKPLPQRGSLAHSRDHVFQLLSWRWNQWTRWCCILAANQITRQTIWQASLQFLRLTLSEFIFSQAPAAAPSFDLPEAFRWMRNGRWLPPPPRRYSAASTWSVGQSLQFLWIYWFQFWSLPFIQVLMGLWFCFQVFKVANQILPLPRKLKKAMRATCLKHAI